VIGDEDFEWGQAKSLGLCYMLLHLRGKPKDIGLEEKDKPRWVWLMATVDYWAAKLAPAAPAAPVAAAPVAAAPVVAVAGGGAHLPAAPMVAAAGAGGGGPNPGGGNGHIGAGPSAGAGAAGGGDAAQGVNASGANQGASAVGAADLARVRAEVKAELLAAGFDAAALGTLDLTTRPTP
jgi:hypothetical protein